MARLPATARKEGARFEKATLDIICYLTPQLHSYTLDMRLDIRRSLPPPATAQVERHPVARISAIAALPSMLFLRSGYMLAPIPLATTQVERHPVARLPAIAREAGAPFDAYRLLRFADSALTWMAGVASSRPGEHWRFEHVPARGCIEAHVVEGGDLPARVDAVYREAAEAAEAGQGQGQGQQEGEQGYGEGEEEEQEYVAGGYQVSGVGDVDGGGVEPGDGEEEEG